MTQARCLDRDDHFASSRRGHLDGLDEEWAAGSVGARHAGFSQDGSLEFHGGSSHSVMSTLMIPEGIHPIKKPDFGGSRAFCLDSLTMTYFRTGIRTIIGAESFHMALFGMGRGGATCYGSSDLRLSCRIGCARTHLEEVRDLDLHFCAFVAP